MNRTDDKQDSGRELNSSASRTKDNLDELVKVIVERAKEASPNLRTQLAGTLELFVRDRPFRIGFDFSANPAKIMDPATKSFDCVLEIEERTLMRIDRGELNSQLALVSDKVTVRGKAGLAVYFFNLLGD
jgi:ubiquinone biosynthesis protein UbiJ